MKTWEECRDAGLSLTAAAKHLGKSISAGHNYARRHGWKFPADPEFAAAHAARSSARMKARHADPEFAAAHAARMKARHADPEFAAARDARLKALNADPEFAAAHAARSSARMKARHAKRRDALSAYEVAE